MQKNQQSIPLIAWAFFILGFVIVAGFVVRTFRPPHLPGKVVYEIKLDKTNNADGKISEAVIRKELAEALIAVETRAANEYNDKFITLLTVLALFGIAWPLVVAFAQYKFNERELDKIQAAEKNASDALTNAVAASANATDAWNNATKALNDAHKALGETNKLRADTKEAYINTLKRTRASVGTFELVYASMASGRSVDYANRYYALGLLCRFWSVQLSKEIEVDPITVDCMIKGVKRIKTEFEKPAAAKSCKNILANIRRDLPQNINAKDPKILEQIEILYKLLDEKIAAFDQWLASTEEVKDKK